MLDSIGRIDDAAQTHFGNHVVHTVVRKEQVSNRRQNFELGQVSVSFLIQPFIVVQHRLPISGKGLIGNQVVVDHKSLIVHHNVRRSMYAHRISRFLQDGRKVRGHGSLSVGPGHVKNIQFFFRISQKAEKSSHPVQSHRTFSRSAVVNSINNLLTIRCHFSLP